MVAIAVVAATLASSGCQPVDPVPPAPPVDPVIRPPDPEPPRRYVTPIAPVLQVTEDTNPVDNTGYRPTSSPCSDAELITIFRLVNDNYPQGGACDRDQYGWGGLVDGPNDLREQVWTAMHSCGDVWISQAFLELVGRLPTRTECDGTRYNGGRWTSWGDLKRLISETNPPLDPPTSFAFTGDPAWRTAVLVFQDFDVGPDSLPGREGNLATTRDGRYQGHYKDLDEVNGYAARLPRTIRAWSDGRLAASVDVYHLDRPLRDADIIGYASDNPSTPANERNYTVDVGALREEMDRINPRNPVTKLPRYDTVMVLFPSDQGSAGFPGMAGLAYTPSEQSNGSGFVAISAPDPSTTTGRTSWQGPGPSEEILVHEWLHTLESYYRDIVGTQAFRDALPVYRTDFGAGTDETRVLLDSAPVSFLGYTPWLPNDTDASGGVNRDPSVGTPNPGRAGTWKPFLRDFMLGRIRGKLGITAEMLGHSRPTAPGTLAELGGLPALPRISVPIIGDEPLLERLVDYHPDPCLDWPYC